MRGDTTCIRRAEALTFHIGDTSVREPTGLHYIHLGHFVESLRLQGLVSVAVVAK